MVDLDATDDTVEVFAAEFFAQRLTMHSLKWDVAKAMPYVVQREVLSDVLYMCMYVCMYVHIYTYICIYRDVCMYILSARSCLKCFQPSTLNHPCYCIKNGSKQKARPKGVNLESSMLSALHLRPQSPLYMYVCMSDVLYTCIHTLNHLSPPPSTCQYLFPYLYLYIHVYI